MLTILVALCPGVSEAEGLEGVRVIRGVLDGCHHDSHRPRAVSGDRRSHPAVALGSPTVMQRRLARLLVWPWWFSSVDRHFPRSVAELVLFPLYSILEGLCDRRDRALLTAVVNRWRKDS